MKKTFAVMAMVMAMMMGMTTVAMAASPGDVSNLREAGPDYYAVDHSFADCSYEYRAPGNVTDSKEVVGMNTAHFWKTSRPGAHTYTYECNGEEYQITAVFNRSGLVHVNGLRL